MSAATERIAITGAGAVTPAGWGLAALRAAIDGGPVPAAEPLGAPDGAQAVAHRRAVPRPEEKLPFLRDARLRRTSPVGRYLAAAAVEALGDRSPERLAIVVSSYTGCVNYSQRFYREVLADPSTASPIVFPETVFNAPASHLSALLGSDEINYTLVGDQSQFATGLELAARWLIDDEADAVLVAAAEESDWLTAAALGLFEDHPIVAEGAGALLLERSTAPAVELTAISDIYSYTRRQPRADALSRLDAEIASWPAAEVPPDPQSVFGNSFGAAPAIHCAAAYALLEDQKAAKLRIPIHGNNQACAAVQLQRQA